MLNNREYSLEATSLQPSNIPQTSGVFVAYALERYRESITPTVERINSIYRNIVFRGRYVFFVKSSTVSFSIIYIVPYMWHVHE